MKRLFLLANIALVALCLSTASLGANIKVVCKSDPKHDRAKLIQAMNTAKSGDKIVIIGTCLPKGVQAAARQAYQPKLGRVEVIVTDRPQQYNSWKFDREIPYSPTYDRPLPRAVIIDNSRNINVAPGVSSGVRNATSAAPARSVSKSTSNVKSTSSKSSSRKVSEKNDQAKSDDKDKEDAKDNEEAKDKENSKDEEKAKDEENAKDEGKANDEENAKEEAAPQEEAAPEEKSNSEEEAAPESSSEPQSEPAESEAGPAEDSGSDGGSDSSGGDSE